MDKKQIRKAMTELLKTCRKPDPDVVTRKICSLPEYREASLVLAYIPLRSEVDVSGVIDRAVSDGKTVLVPDIQPGDFRQCRTDWRSSLERFSNKCLYPADSPVLNIVSLNSIIGSSDKIKGIILVPGLAFTEFGTRLGRGAGYYDQLLNLTDKSEVADFISIGICRGEQLLEDLPQQPHDRSVRMVITF